MFQMPLVNPAIPVIKPIDGGIYPGMMVMIDGFAPGNSQGFQINLASGPIIDGPQRSNILLHFNPRFNDNYVTRNSYMNGSWGTEESGGNLTIRRDVPFRIMILVEEQQFKIAVDGNHFAEYNHRYPFHQINTLQIHGQVVIHKVEFTQSGPPPPGYQGSCAPGNVCTVDVVSPPVPYRQPVPRYLKPGTTFIISGRTNQISGRFFINIEGEGPDPQDPDVLMHFNPRFDGPMPEVVRNSYINGCWGHEEVMAPPSPFLPGNNFDMIIMVEAGRFMVAVNGQHYIAFDHRQPVEQGKFIHISGDCTIFSLKMSQPLF